MKKIVIFFLIIFSISSANQKAVSVLVVYTDLSEGRYILQATESVLQEEGVPYTFINSKDLLNKEPLKLLSTHPAVIIPDKVNKTISEDMKYWFHTYVKGGGNLFIIYDAGVKDRTKKYRKKPIFEELTGVNYCLYDSLKDKAYTTDSFKFTKEGLSLIDIPPGKTVKGFITGYKYGKLKYPVSVNKTVGKKLKILAHTGEGYVGASVNKFGRGKVLFVNLPLSHLKAYSDDLPLRAFVRFFLFRLTKIPHLVNTPYGKGGLIINWHIDSKIDWKSIPMMIKKGYFRKEIIYSSHITAGDFLDEPGDSKGFDACGKGKKIARLVGQYGITGSHGGWAHNWFARKLVNGELSRDEIRKYIKMNNECLEQITGYKIKEYSAPIGVHPQPTVTEILEELGMEAYYYTGDTGSSPNRTFYEGKMVSEQVIAFPITPFGKTASFYEMEQNGISSNTVYTWLKEMVDFVSDRKTVRLIYSHPYDIPLYPDAIKNFLKYAVKKVKEGKLYIKPMIYFTEYIKRFLNTEFSFVLNKSSLQVSLYNPEGLQGISVAVPERFAKQCDIKPDFTENGYKYFVIKKQTDKVSFRCSYENK